MPRVGTGELVDAAYRACYGVGAFNVVQVEHAEAILAAAEATAAPVVLQVSQNCVRYHGSLEPVARAMLALADRASVPVAVHLDHAESVELVTEAVELGFGSVMFDASASPHEENVRTTRDVARLCHERSVWVEAELGEIGGKDGAHAPGVRTHPAEAAAFVASTGVDALAVAVGTSHAMLERTARLDLQLIGRLHAAVPVPLVLHGSSGVPDEDLTRAVAAGMTKVNIATQLNKVFTSAVRDHLGAHPDAVDPRGYLGEARSAASAECARLIGVLGTRR